MGVLLMALSCIKTEGLDEVPEGEICMSPVLSDMAMTRAGDGTTPYPDGSSFGAFAYYTNAEAGDAWTATPQTYFQNHEFKSTDGLCTGVDPVYWPLAGSLIFAGYSPYDDGDDVTFNATTKTLTIKDYEVDGSTDLMYFLPTLTDGKYAGLDGETTSVPIEFHHALSLLNFDISAKSGDESKLKFKSLTLKSVCTQGKFTVSATAPTAGIWEKYATSTASKSLHSNASGTALTTSLNIPYYVIPGEACEIEIVYFDNGVEKSHTISADPISTWDIGRKYQYNIKLSVGLDPVIIDPDKASASIEHIYQSGTTLAGSRLNLNLGLKSEELARITNLKVTVTKGGVTYKEKTFATVSSDTISITEGKLYLPYKNGKFKVTFEYNDSIEDRVTEIDVDPQKPSFNMTVNVSATMNSCTVLSASVNISDAVLSEVPLAGDPTSKAVFLFRGAASAGTWLYSGDSAFKSTNHVFLTNWTMYDSPKNNVYTLNTTGLYFDGLQPNQTVINPVEGCTISGTSNASITPVPVAPKINIGDYYYSDGTTGSEYKSTAVGVVFYVGDPHEVDPTIPAEYTTGLVVGLEEITDIVYDVSPSLTSTNVFKPDTYYSNVKTTSTSEFRQTTTAKNLIAVSRAYDMTAQHASYRTSLYQSYSLGLRTNYESGWYIPCCREYSLMYKEKTVLNAKQNFTALRSWSDSDESTAFSKLTESPCFGYHTVWQANYDGGWRCVNYYCLNNGAEGIYPAVVRNNTNNANYPHIGRVIFAF